MNILELLPIKKFTIAGHNKNGVYESLKITASQMRDIDQRRQSKDSKTNDPKDYETNYETYTRILKQRETQSKQ